MIDFKANIDLFEKSFTPHGDGYVYYPPSYKQGGKFVTKEEFQSMIRDLETFWSWKGIFSYMIVSVILVVTAVIILQPSDTVIVDPSNPVISVGVWGMMLSIIARGFWLSDAPRRLVKGRPDVVPPRTKAEIEQMTYSMTSWQTLIFILLMTGVFFIAKLRDQPDSFMEWALLIGIGATFVVGCWAAFKRYRYDKSE